MRPIASPPRRQRVGAGRVEIVPEPVRFARLRANVSDPACRLLVLGVLVAQTLDTFTTAIALRQTGYYERNPLLGTLAASPATALLVKLTAVGAMTALAILRLPTRRARVTLTLALALSAFGSILNVASLLGAVARL